MRFDDFIKHGNVRKASLDIPLIKSLLTQSEKHIATAKTLIVNDTTKDTVLVTFYEALREVIEAIATKDGYKVYSHEAFTYLLREKGDAAIAERFDRYRKLRNGINYYGKEVPIEEVEFAAKEIMELVKDLREKYFKQ